MNSDPKKNILGCFVSGPATIYGDSKIVKEFAAKRSELFRSYIWGEAGIDVHLKKLNHIDYGTDLILILLQFYLIPIPYEIEHLREIESYRKRERSIGVPIIPNEENFFAKPDLGRKEYLKSSILYKLDLVANVVKRRKLDTKIDQLKSDLLVILQDY